MYTNLSFISLHQLLALGSMPARDDFEMEHENEAEVLVLVNSNEPVPISRLGSEDKELEMNLKLTHVKIYQNKLN